MEFNSPQKFKDTVPARTAQVLTDPLRSFGSYSIHKLSGGRLMPELGQYFGPSEEIEEDIENIQTTLSEIDNRLSGGENFINDLFAHWNSEKDQMEDLVGKRVTEYVVFNRKNGRHILFAEEGDKIYPILLPSEEDTNAVKLSMFGIDQPVAKKDFLSESVAREEAINEALAIAEINPDDVVIRRLNSVCNDFELRRHSTFERDGEMFEDLRSMGAMSIGEIQTLTRFMVSSGLSFKDGNVTIDPSYESLWLEARVISLDKEEVRNKTQIAQKELNSFVQQVVYYKAINEYFVENPAIVREFYKTEIYLKHRKDFVNSHLSAKGRTEEDVARAMIANFCLYKFEGLDVAESPSLKYLKGKKEFVQDIDTFLNDKGFEVQVSLQDLMPKLKNDIFDHRVNSEQKIKTLADASVSIGKVLNEMWRHVETRKIFGSLSRLSPFDIVDDEEKSSKVFRVIITNLGLAKVPGERRFTMSSYLNKVPYYPRGSEVLPFDEGQAVYSDVRDSIRYIFNGSVLDKETGIESAYESQVARIFVEGTTILKFLSEDPRVPQKIKEFIQTIQSEDLATRILERYGPISDQDPQIINRFFVDGFDRFQTMTTHRYVTDFVRGVETNLIMLTSRSWLNKLKRRTTDNWKNYDFSQLPNGIIEAAIQKTLEDGEHRLDILNHAITERTTLKDKQELLEKVFGWNTYDMWFLRWEKFWNVWNTLGGAWDCMCFMRKPIFNPGTFKQY